MSERFDPGVLIEYIDDLDKEFLYELSCLQVELIQLQHFIQSSRQRLVVLFEGRDTAGKGGAIHRFTRHLNPRHYRVIALPKPTDAERGQWFFQRYIRHLPNPGDIAFYDRSWYNRAVVEPVMGFCTEEQYQAFMEQVNVIEKFLVDDGIHLVKIWYSIDYEEQIRRMQERVANPLKRWKLSPVDQAAAEKWHDFTEHKEAMFQHTSTPHAPWHVVLGNAKRSARLESIRLVLSQFDYPNKGVTGQRIEPDTTVVTSP